MQPKLAGRKRRRKRLPNEDHSECAVTEPSKDGKLKVIVRGLFGILVLVVIGQINQTPASTPEPPAVKATIRLNQELLCPREQGGRQASNEEIKRCIDNLDDPYKKK